MDAPEGATLKPWGWQKQIYADAEREIWLGYGVNGRTSLHRHDSHYQTVTVIEGKMRVHEPRKAETECFGVGLGEDNYCDMHTVHAGRRHYLSFCPDPCWFTENYDKNPDKPAVPVTEDTIRE